MTVFKNFQYRIQKNQSEESGYFRDQAGDAEADYSSGDKQEEQL
jgi:hypothetical protein